MIDANSPPDNPRLTYALKYAALGLPVIPLHEVLPDGKCSCGKADCTQQGKHPRTKHGCKDGTIDPKVIRRWWQTWPTANVGICTGRHEPPMLSVFVIGPDGQAGIEALAELEAWHEPLPETPRAKTGSGGQHHLFVQPPGVSIKNRRNHRGVPIDVRGDGGLIVAAPSRNANGPYVWEIGPGSLPIAEPPPWILEFVEDEPRPAPPALTRSSRTTARARGGAAIEDRAIAYLDKIPPAVSGQGGHRQTFYAARAVVYGFDLGPDAGFRILADHYNPRCEPPWSERELQHKCRDAHEKPFSKPRGWLLLEQNGCHSNGTSHVPNISHRAHDHAHDKQDQGEQQARFHLTDLGNARRVVAQYGKDLHFCFDWKQFLTWDGQRWAPDVTGATIRMVKDAQARLYRETAEALAALAKDAEADDEERKRKAAQLTREIQHALKWEDAKRIAACLDLIKSEAGIPIRPADMDRDSWSLNLENGTLNLKTGELRPHERDDFNTKLAPVTYDPTATCPLWDRCLDRWMGGNGKLGAYLRRIIGYSLTGDVSEQVLFFLYGDGSNGKSTFLNTLRELLGDYGCQAVSELLLAKRHEAHPTERADLFGRRFVATVEVDEGRQMAEALLKQLTGGENLKARKMRENFFDLPPTWKIFFGANHKPLIRGTDFAVWRRIRLIPFQVTISDSEKDKNLMAKLRRERSGILNWALQGCLEWQKDGLADPPEVREATAAYQREQDSLATFFSDCCFIHPEAKVKSSLLLKRYQDWSGDRNMTPQTFRARLNDKGYFSRETSGSFYYHGIGLPAEESDDRWQ